MKKQINSKKEIWRPYNKDYEVSNFGRVRSVDRFVSGKNNSKRYLNGKILSLNWKRHGYPSVKIYNKNERIHRLVAKVFIPNPNNYNVINHINGIKEDNRVENLEWCTHKHNINHAFRIGLIKPKTGKVVINTLTGETYKSARQVADLIGMKPNTLIYKLIGKRRNNTPYKYL